MSERDEKVHYQISVTGRQAAAFFLALLVALGLSFFFGMKTGAAAKKGQETIVALSQASDVPVTAPKAEEKRGGSKAADDVKLGFGPEKAAEPPKPSPTAGPTRSAPPTPTKPPEATATPVPKPAAAPAKAVTLAKAAGKKEPYWVQVLATQRASIADDLTKKLKADGFPADVTPVPGKAGWFRVRVGPYTDRTKAESTAAKIQKVEKTNNRPFVVP
jgi:cell division septation protein DedD